MRLAAIVAVAVVIVLAASLPASAQSYALRMSRSPTRSSATSLEGGSVSGLIYVFTGPDTSVRRVRYFLDDPQMLNAPRHVDNNAPYDFAGGTATTANPFDTATVSNGSHIITASIELSKGGGTQVVHATFTVANSVPTTTYQLLVSTSPTRANAVGLHGYTASGSIYVFASPAEGVARVRFFLDDPSMNGAPRQTEGAAPYDFAGTAADGSAFAFNTAAIADGSHVITAAIDRTSGGTVVVSSTFSVANNVPGLAWDPNPVRMTVAPGGQQTVQARLTFSGGSASFTLSESAPWLTVTPVTGTTPATIALAADATGLPAGTYTATVIASAPGVTSDTLSIVLAVGQAVPLDQVHLAWTGDPATTLVVVWRTFDTATPSAVEYRAVGETAWRMAVGALRPSGTTGTLHEVALSGLTPSTAYEYRVQGDGGVWSAVYSTRTAPTRGPADFEVIYVADTGLTGRTDGLTTGTQRVIDAIAALNPLVVLPGGDYAYFDTDTRFGTLENTIDAWFNQMAPIATRVPMMPTYGNHEVLLGEGFVPWAARFATPQGFDGRRYYSFDIGDVHFVSILAVDEFDALPAAAVQWIEQDVVAARAAGQRWIVPFFHVSPFSDGANHRSNLNLRAQLGPLFERLGVKVAISSHDQSFERTYPLLDVPATNTVTSTALRCYTMADGVTWVKVSPGGKLSNKNAGFSQFLTQPPPPWTAVRDNTMHHFARIVVTAAGTLAVETYGMAGDGTPPMLQDRFEYTAGTCPEELAFSHTDITMTAPVGGRAEAEVDVTSTMTGQPFELLSGAPWLTLAPASGTTPTRVRLVADAVSLAAGSYTTTVTAQGAGAVSDTLRVSLTVGTAYTLLVSAQANRATPQPLDGSTVSGNIYVFSSPATNVARVQFFLDDPAMTRPPRQVERTAPHDFAGGTVDVANPFDTSTVSAGAHTITAAIELTTGIVHVIHGQFTVLSP